MACAITGDKIVNTYAIKAFGPYPFPCFREGFKTMRALLRSKESLTSLGYREFEVFRDTKNYDGTMTRKLID